MGNPSAPPTLRHAWRSVAGFSVIATVAGLAILVAIGKSQAASEANKRNFATNLVTQAQAAGNADTRVAMMRLLESNRLAPSSAALDAIRSRAMENLSIVGSHPAQNSSVVDIGVSGNVEYSIGTDRILRVWDLTKSKSVAAVSLADLPRSLTVSKSGRSSIVITDNNLYAFALVQDKLVTIYRCSIRDLSILSEGFSPDESMLYALRSDGLILVFKVGSPADAVQDRLQISTDDGTFETNGNPITATADDPFAFPNWSVLLATRANGVLRVNLATGRATSVIPTQPGEIDRISENTNGELAVLSDGKIALWSQFSTPSLDQNIDAPGAKLLIWGGATDLYITTQDSVQILIAGAEYDWSTGQIWGPATIYTGDVRCIATTTSRDGLEVGTVTGRVFALEPDNNVLGLPNAQASTALGFAGPGSLIVTHTNGSPSAVDYLAALKVGRDGAARGGYPDQRRFTPDPTWWPLGSSFYVNSVAVSGHLLAVVGQDASRHGAVMVWNLQNGRALAKLPFTDNHDGGDGNEPFDIVTSVAISDDESSIYAYNVRLGVVRTWATRDWRTSPDVTLGEVSGISLIPHTHLLVSARVDDRHGLILTDAVSRAVKVLVSNGDYSRAYVSPDGRQIIATSLQASNLAFFNVRGQIQKTLTLPAFPIEGAWSPDGHSFAISLGDGDVAIVDAKQESVSDSVLVPIGNDQNSYGVSLAYSSDSKYLAVQSLHTSGSAKTAGPTTLWDMHPDWGAIACTIAGSGLSRSEWNQYIGSAQPFRSLC